MHCPDNCEGRQQIEINNNNNKCVKLNITVEGDR